MRLHLTFEQVTTAVSVLSAFVTAAFTIVLARLTKQMVDEAARNNARLESADVVRSITPIYRAHTHLELVVRNVGQATARDVEITVPNRFVKTRSGFEQGEDLRVSLATLLPGTEMRTWLNSYVDLKAEGPVEASVTFRDVKRKRFEIKQDVTGLARSLSLRADPVPEAAAKLASLADQLRLIVSSSGLRVDVWTQSDRDAADRQMRTWVAEQDENAKQEDRDGQST